MLVQHQRAWAKHEEDKRRLQWGIEASSGGLEAHDAWLLRTSCSASAALLHTSEGERGLQFETRKRARKKTEQHKGVRRSKQEAIGRESAKSSRAHAAPHLSSLSNDNTVRSISS